MHRDQANASLTLEPNRMVQQTNGSDKMARSLNFSSKAKRDADNPLSGWPDNRLNSACWAENFIHSVKAFTGYNLDL